MIQGSRLSSASSSSGVAAGGGRGVGSEVMLRKVVSEGRRENDLGVIRGGTLARAPPGVVGIHRRRCCSGRMRASIEFVRRGGLG